MQKKEGKWKGVTTKKSERSK